MCGRMYRGNSREGISRGRESEGEGRGWKRRGRSEGGLGVGGVVLKAGLGSEEKVDGTGDIWMLLLRRGLLLKLGFISKPIFIQRI